MRNTGRPPVHLWIYNHPFHGISDQVDFFVMALTQHGYPVSVGRRPGHTALNVVIENFSAASKDILMKFCKSSRKRVAVIMTEHLDFDDDRITIHGDPLWSDNDYMHPATQLGRIKNLIDCLPYLRCFLVLGDLPELRNMSGMLPGIDVRTIPFPKLGLADDQLQARTAVPGKDLLFTGFMTDYRADILARLEEGGLSVDCPRKFVSRKRRDLMTKSARLVLNIPQREDWRWLSLMRVIAALRSGRPTVSLGTRDTSKISASCLQLDIANPGWREALGEHARNWQALFSSCIDGYSSMATEFEREYGFPYDLFEFWSITDRLSLRRSTGTHTKPFCLT